MHCRSWSKSSSVACVSVLSDSRWFTVFLHVFTTQYLVFFWNRWACSSDVIICFFCYFITVFIFISLLIQQLVHSPLDNVSFAIAIMLHTVGKLHSQMEIRIIQDKCPRLNIIFILLMCRKENCYSEKIYDVICTFYMFATSYLSYVILDLKAKKRDRM